MKSLLFSLFIFLCTIYGIAAQDFETLKKAFAESYLYESMGEYEEAAQKLSDVYDAGSYEMNLRLGWLYYNSGKQDLSIKYYQKAMELMPYSVEARLGYAYPLSSLGNWDEVVNNYRKILEIDPQNSLVNYRMGLIYYSRNEYDTAYKYLEKVINLYPFDYDALLLMAWTNYQMGKYREAKILFQKVLLYNPNDTSATEGLDLIK